ncbi:MAG: intradiol ring-cleavage dioxygenase [Thalassobaculum sp.]|uniref:dioxygenase family protein n=1 Tax=Thalassobaculum sp. TaxID=2022740 RepID=UPI0032EBD5F6
MPISRRDLTAGLFAAPVLLSPMRVAAAPALPPTPACDDRPDPTPRATEGPFFTPLSPRRHDLAADVDGGEALLVGGFVVGPACAPVAGAVVDVWQADHRGRYDNDGYRLRGHVETDAAGRWWFATVVPGRYPGRTRHIHVKVGPGKAGGTGRVLTTQLFFPGEPGNARDFLYDERLLLRMAGDGAERFGRFDFVLG